MTSFHSGGRSIDLSFLGPDLRNQIENSKNVLKQIQVLQELLPLMKDNVEAYHRLQEAINQLIGVTSSITSNVANVSQVASTAIATTIGPSKKAQ